MTPSKDMLKWYKVKEYMNKLSPFQIHSLKWFIQYYESIPVEKWCQGQFHDGDKSCALGHLGATGDKVSELPPLAKELCSIINVYRYGNLAYRNELTLYNTFSTTGINDASPPCRPQSSYPGNPKVNILSVLKKILEAQNE